MQLSRAYANARLNNPSTIADSHLRHATRQTHWTYEERILALEGSASICTDQQIEKLN